MKSFREFCEESEMSLEWISSTDNWYSLQTLNLHDIDETNGVYIIWYEDNPGRVVYVGQGKFYDRFNEHRNNQAITKYAEKGVLLVTWAAVPKHRWDGIENYLAGIFRPLVGSIFPQGPPDQSVNIPPIDVQVWDYEPP